MACSGYLPRFKKQLDGSKYAGLNCTCASAAMAADYDSCGSVNITGATVRIWTGDTSGGTRLAQVDDALRVHKGVDLDTRYRYPWEDFVARINAGRGAILQGWYAPIRDSKFGGSDTFGGNHAIFVPPGWGAMDPLADGRRAGIYEYHGEVYPQALLKDFAGRLNVGGSVYKRLGNGLVYAAFTKDNTLAYKVTIHPTPPATKYAFFEYFVQDGQVIGRTVHYTSGFSATSTSPRLYHWSKTNKNYSLVKLTSGSRAGQFVDSKFAREV